MMKEQTVDAVGLTAGKTATFGGGVSAILFGLSAYDVAAITGAVVAVLGLCLQWYYNRRRDRREERESKVRIERYRWEMEREAEALSKELKGIFTAENRCGPPRP